MELKITKEKVIEAASKCSTAKNILETLFPEAFDQEDTIKDGKMFGKPLFSLNPDDNALISPRQNGVFGGKGFCLSSGYDWQIVKDSFGLNLLIPKRKGNG